MALNRFVRAASPVEIFASPSNYLFVPLIQTQTNTLGWTDVGVRSQTQGAAALGEPDQPLGAAQGNSFASSSALDVSVPALPKTWFGAAADVADASNSARSLLPGARRLGIYVASDTADTPVLTWEIVGFNQWMQEVTEELVTTGRTHGKQAAWISWADNYTNNKAAASVAASFFNPNSGGVLPNNYPLGAGGTANGVANWGRVPLASAFQSRNAFLGIKKLTLKARSGHSSATIAVPNWKSLDFGLRTRITETSDILGGLVEVTPIAKLLAEQAASFPTAAALNVALYPLYNHLSLRHLSFDTTYNVLSLAVSVSGGHPSGMNCPYVMGGNTTGINNVGEMPMGVIDHLWTLAVYPRFRRK